VFRIVIENLEFETIIGILEFERIKPQKVRVDVKILYQDGFIDYIEVIEIIKKSMQEEKFSLLEDALIEIEKRLLDKFKIKELFISIKKPEILKEALVGVEILRKY
jgi:dihydroneopterin aldolase